MEVNYWCPNSEKSLCPVCKGRSFISTHEVSDYKEEKVPCLINSELAQKPMGIKSVGLSGKMTPSEIRKDRRKRSANHFKNEILPNIPNSTDEGKHFRKKYSKTGK